METEIQRDHIMYSTQTQVFRFQRQGSFLNTVLTGHIPQNTMIPSRVETRAASVAYTHSLPTRFHRNFGIYLYNLTKKRQNKFSPARGQGALCPATEPFYTRKLQGAVKYLGGWMPGSDLMTWEAEEQSFCDDLRKGMWLLKPRAWLPANLSTGGQCQLLLLMDDGPAVDSFDLCFEPMTMLPLGLDVGSLIQIVPFFSVTGHGRKYAVGRIADSSAHQLCGLKEVTSLTLSFSICDNRPHLVGFL